MASAMKYICALGFLAILAFADGAGECGSSSPDMEAMKLFPCLSAAKDERAPVSRACCDKVWQVGQNFRCMCAAMLSNTARRSGGDPAVALTIPKRCNFANRPVGYKCGPYTLP